MLMSALFWLVSDYEEIKIEFYITIKRTNCIHSLVDTSSCFISIDNQYFCHQEHGRLPTILFSFCWYAINEKWTLYINAYGLLVLESFNVMMIQDVTLRYINHFSNRSREATTCSGQYQSAFSFKAAYWK